MVGYTDRPIDNITEDIFGVESYIKGITSFLLNCETPMTMAAQGDWGSGKTSVMKLLRRNLETKTHTIWFNTWQFSQFELGDRLPFLLLTKLVEGLQTDHQSEALTTLKKSIKVIGRALGNLGGQMIDRATGLSTVTALEEAQNAPDITEAITTLREQFQACITAAAKRTDCKRVVIFIDDLDRLRPERAVQLLEVLKLFLDCEHCVFVLAIDYNVVIQGVKLMYGSEMTLDKGRSFFDKIIQVPFKMPVANYDITRFVKQALSAISVKDETPYINLIRDSIGYNPRAMKRLFNAFLLLRNIRWEAKPASELENRQLFAVLCLQLSYEEIYNFIVRRREELKNRFFRQLSEQATYEALNGGDNSKMDELDELIIDLYDLHGDVITEGGTALMKLMDSVFRAVASDKGLVMGEAIHSLRDILGVSTSTATELDPLTTPLERIIPLNEFEGRGIRYQNVMDAEFAYHKITDNVIYSPVRKIPGWNGAELRAFRFFGTEVTCTVFREMLCWVITALYQRDPIGFERAREFAEKNNLTALFHYDEDSYRSPAVIPGTDIQFETSTSNQQKIMDLRKLMRAMNLDPGELELDVRLAHRKKERSETDEHYDATT